jgi:ER lumen protein retaining receptor
MELHSQGTFLVYSNLNHANHHQIFYTLSSLYIIFLMTSVYARTREREKAWKFGLYCLAGAIVVAPFWFLIFKTWVIRHNTFMGVCMPTPHPSRYWPFQLLWVFSEILESVCVIPQLLLLRQTTVPTVIDSYYLVTLGAYRAMYVLNWIVRGANEPAYADPTSWVWGSIQTALMVDFAWVYYTRQRVKLRRGGVVDSEDLGRGWLVGRFAGRKSVDFDYDEEAAPRNEAPAPTNKWGRRGISVSADEGVEGAPKRNGSATRTMDPESQPLADPAAFEDESDDDAPPPAVAGSSAKAHDSGVRRDEWDDDVDDDAEPHDDSAK